MTVANTTRSLVILVCLCGFASQRPIHAQQQPDSDGTSLDLAFNQIGSPVGLRGYLASVGTFMYETAKVENVSAKSISAVTFGVLVADPGNRKTLTLLRSPAVNVSLPPGKKQDVNVRLLPLSQLQDLERSLPRTPKVTLGVLAIE